MRFFNAIGQGRAAGKAAQIILSYTLRMRLSAKNKKSQKDYINY
tara:strand:+ start:208 stop:339 length:132 start_codon:yes stop_codon:yes gene_type:complete